jgi:hypothetical protein
MKKSIDLLPTSKQEISIQSEDLFGTSKILSRFEPIQLDQMEKRLLLDRIDTKFLFNAAQLPQLLEEVQSDYSILEIKDAALQPYHTLYFDTPDFENYFNHHNGKRPRFKIRMRKYLNSGNTFLEIKEKDNKNRTIKSRKEIRDIATNLSPEHYQFIREIYAPGFVPLKPVVWNRYNRLTLVNKYSLERVTIDLNYIAFNENGFISWNEFAIAEIKQGSRILNTRFYQAMKSRYFKPVNFSKYCISMALLTPQLKANRFKVNIDAIKSNLQRSVSYVV